MPARAGRYEPRDPTQSVLFHVVRDHFETFRAQSASLRDSEGLPVSSSAWKRANPAARHPHVSIALGPQRGAKVARFSRSPEDVVPVTLGPCQAALDGFDLHAGVVVRAGERDRLERLCRYVLRPPLALTRLRVDAEGQVCLALRHQWSDGTTHLRFEPIALLERLAVLIPRPRINLVLYYGVLAPRAPWRAAVVASAGSEWSVAPPVTEATEARADAGRRRRDGYLWAELMRRTFGIDVLECQRCGSRLRLIALIEQAQVVDRILRHLGLPTSRPAARPPRAPPLVGGDDFCQMDRAADAT